MSITGILTNSGHPNIGTSSQSGNSIIGYAGQLTTPAYTTYGGVYPSYTTAERYDIQIRKVENGYILKKDNKEYIITDSSQVIKYLDLLDEKVK